MRILSLSFSMTCRKYRVPIFCRFFKFLFFILRFSRRFSINGKPSMLRLRTLWALIVVFSFYFSKRVLFHFIFENLCDKHEVKRGRGRRSERGCQSLGEERRRNGISSWFVMDCLLTRESHAKHREYHARSSRMWGFFYFILPSFWSSVDIFFDLLFVPKGCIRTPLTGSWKATTGVCMYAYCRWLAVFCT